MGGSSGLENGARNMADKDVTLDPSLVLVPFPRVSPKIIPRGLCRTAACSCPDSGGIRDPISAELCR